MSGSTIGGVIGAIIGGIITESPQGAMYGYAIGSGVGGLIDPQKIDGPRLTDLKPQASEYGRPIPIVYGTVALGGNVIWASDYVQEQGESGGKGGGPTVTNYTYFGNFAIAFAEGECSIGRMWAGPEKRLIWDGVTLEGGGKVRFYTGSEDQLPDPLIESYLGAGNVPAYRGTCYVVFEHFPLLKDGNTLPFITAEIGGVAKGCPVPVLQSSGLYMSDPAPAFIAHQPDTKQIFYDKLTGKTYWMRQSSSGQWFLNRMDLSTGETGPELMIASGGQVRIAWDNSGTAQYIVEGDPKYTIVNLVDWVTGIDTTISHKYTERDGSVTKMLIPLADIAYTGNGTFGYLSTENTVNTFGVSTGSYGIYPVPSDYTWNSIGVRTGGSLTSMGEAGAAASFISQPSNFAPDSTQWDLYIGGSHNILMSFSAAAYVQGSSGFVKMTSPAFGNVVSSVYDEATDRVYVWENTVGLVAYDPAKLTPETWPREPCIYYQSNLAHAQQYANGTQINVASYVSLAMLPTGEVLVATWPNGDVFKVDVSARVVAAGATLAYVVADLSKRAGLSVGQVNVDALTDIVDGYSIARQTTVRNAIDALRPAYYFDAVESGGVVKYVKRGGAPVATIDADDLDARSEGEAAGDPLLTTRQMEVELPRVVNVNYLLAATDYSPATKLAKRLVGASGNESTLDLPLVLTDTKAQEVADVNLQVAWVQRLTYAFNLPRKYSDLEVTDPIVVKGNGMRLTKTTRTPRGVIRCEAVADGTTFYRPNTTVTETPPTDQTVFVPGTTSLELM